MKRIVCVILLGLLMLSGCAKRQAETTSEEVVQQAIPQELPGVWVSANAGKLNLLETITFFENGELSVNSKYQDKDMGTIYGTYQVKEHTIYCDITQGSAPYQVCYDYQIDGRELTLVTDNNTAHYLKTS